QSAFAAPRGARHSLVPVQRPLPPAARAVDCGERRAGLFHLLRRGAPLPVSPPRRSVASPRPRTAGAPSLARRVARSGRPVEAGSLSRALPPQKGRVRLLTDFGKAFEQQQLRQGTEPVLPTGGQEGAA